MTTIQIQISKSCVVCGKPVMLRKPHEYLDQAKTMVRHTACSIQGPQSPTPGGSPGVLPIPKAA